MIPDWMKVIATLVVVKLQEAFANTKTLIDDKAAALARQVMIEYGFWDEKSSISTELPPWLKSSFPILAGFLVRTLRGMAKSTETTIDDAAVDILEGALIKAGLL